MKTKTKALALALCAVLLVVGTVFATMAYLTSTDTVVNTFTVGKVSITLDETDVDLYGVQDGETRVETNEYKLIPGHEYVKDPTVHVAADSEESYIRMIVTITDLADVKAVFGVDATTGYFLPQNFVNGWNDSIWETTGTVVENEDEDTATYEFRYHTTVSTVDGKTRDLEALFTSIVVPDSVENDALATLEDLQINIVAHAIQADGFENAAEAWAAFNK